MELIVKTPLGLEEIAASRVLELEPDTRLVVKPKGLGGLIVIESCPDRSKLMEKILSEIPEVEKVVPVEAEVKARIDEIEEAARKLVVGKLRSDQSFAVRTVRRGSHDFRSVDVNIRVGAAVQEILGAPVDLDNPDKIIQVEIIFDRAALAILDGSSEWKKMGFGKRPSTRFFERISIVQMPYLGSMEGAKEIGRRIGRAVQAYEVKELIIAPNKPANAFELASFIDGVWEGIESRFKIQRKSYGRAVKRVEVYVQDLYQLVRERRGEPLIVFEPEGLQLRDAIAKLKEIISRSKRVSFLFGSREGIPKGVYRLADLVVDLAPAITLPTEIAAPAALTAIYTALNMMNLV
ncbi:MAG TPA: hypothetical protein ENF33_05210 [Nitrososphaeria archaeon]|nr:MAG: hypothetical protein DRN68_05355 [Nitrososphaerota archaeon]HDJ67089.1 hypothetical protein [Nitrososphaeria archaeon]